MKISKSKLREIIREVIREADESDKYSHIGYGKYREKGKEKDKDAQTFKKTDSGKFEPTGGEKGGEKEKPEPKVTKIAADPFGDKDSETGKDYTKKFTGTDEPDDSEWDGMKDDDDYLDDLEKDVDAEKAAEKDDSEWDWMKDDDDYLDDLEKDVDAEKADEDDDDWEPEAGLGYDDEDWEESIIPELQKEFKQYGFTQKSKNWKRIMI